MSGSLGAGAVAILTTADAAAKATMSRTLAAAWRAGTLADGTPATPPERPARPPRPELRPPREMPRRRGAAGRVALLHALAHIELNAIDLAWDLIARFPAPGPGFHDDWVRVADEEATHFTLLAERLAAHGAAYGDLPAHDGLWQAAEATAGDLAARLAVVPLVLEARGLDVTPALIERFAAAGDGETAAVLRIVYRDEIGHVAVGRRWFEAVCAGCGREPVATWQSLVRRHYRGALKPPFNAEARDAAGLTPAFYAPLAGA
ncbi:MAG TPA: ferritin-like domain-containing protein [Stellaceae bacterium]|nr:ferritin-like domain-containing protein [Stellaceae bacterium]